jgi:hypothetical protein
LTTSLDEQWKVLSLLLNLKDRKGKDVPSNTDDYDALVNTLKFEARTPVSVMQRARRDVGECLSSGFTRQIDRRTTERRQGTIANTSSN